MSGEFRAIIDIDCGRGESIPYYLTTEAGISLVLIESLGAFHVNLIGDPVLGLILGTFGMCLLFDWLGIRALAIDMYFRYCLRRRHRLLPHPSRRSVTRTYILVGVVAVVGAIALLIRGAVLVADFLLK